VTELGKEKTNIDAITIKGNNFFLKDFHEFGNLKLKQLDVNG